MVQVLSFWGILMTETVEEEAKVAVEVVPFMADSKPEQARWGSVGMERLGRMGRIMVEGEEVATMEEVVVRRREPAAVALVTLAELLMALLLRADGVAMDKPVSH